MGMLTDTVDLPALLSAEQEVELARAIEAGVLARAVLAGQAPWPAGVRRPELEELSRRGGEAWQQFMVANLRMVLQVSSQAARRHDLAQEELFQEGCVALAQCLMRYDHTRGVRFGSYAFPWVRNAVAQQVALRAGQVESPVWRLRQARQVREHWARLRAEHQREVGLDELAAAVGRDPGWVRLVLAHGARVPLDDVENTALVASGSAQLAFERAERARPEWMRALGSREQLVLALRFGLDDEVERDYEQVARRLGVSSSTVRRVERRALEQARGLLQEAA